MHANSWALRCGRAHTQVLRVYLSCTHTNPGLGSEVAGQLCFTPPTRHALTVKPCRRCSGCAARCSSAHLRLARTRRAMEVPTCAACLLAWKAWLDGMEYGASLSCTLLCPRLRGRTKKSGASTSCCCCMEGPISCMPCGPPRPRRIPSYHAGCQPTADVLRRAAGSTRACLANAACLGRSGGAGSGGRVVAQCERGGPPGNAAARPAPRHT